MFSPSPGKDAWWRHSAFPQYENSVDLTFLITIIEFFVKNTPPNSGIVVCHILWPCMMDGNKALNSAVHLNGGVKYMELPHYCRLKNVQIW